MKEIKMQRNIGTRPTFCIILQHVCFQSLNYRFRLETAVSGFKTSKTDISFHFTVRIQGGFQP